MSCSTCDNFCTCTKEDIDTGNKILRDCFVGHKVNIDKVTLLRYTKKYPDLYIKQLKLLMLRARLVSGRLYEVDYITDMIDMGTYYACEIGSVQAYYNIKYDAWLICYKNNKFWLRHKVFCEGFGLEIGDISKYYGHTFVCNKNCGNRRPDTIEDFDKLRGLNKLDDVCDAENELVQFESIKDSIDCMSENTEIADKSSVKKKKNNKPVMKTNRKKVNAGKVEEFGVIN